jgi:hypothetical protein
LSPVAVFVVFSRFFGETRQETSVSSAAINVTFVVALLLTAVYAGAVYCAGTTSAESPLWDRVAVAVLVALSACAFTFVTEVFRTLAGEYRKQKKQANSSDGATPPT